MAKRIFNLANNLTIIRIIIVPILIVLVLYSSSRASCLVAALLFGLAAFTDWLDGFIARRQNLVTSLGKFLDPLADKLLVSVTLVMLLSLNRVPAWMVALIIAREVGVTGLRIAAARDGIIMESSRLAKYKTAFQLVAVEALLIHYIYAGINFHLVGLLILWIALFITLWSGFVYFIRFFKKTLSSSQSSQ